MFLVATLISSSMIAVVSYVRRNDVSTLLEVSNRRTDVPEFFLTPELGGGRAVGG